MSNKFNIDKNSQVISDFMFGKIVPIVRGPTYKKIYLDCDILYVEGLWKLHNNANLAYICNLDLVHYWLDKGVLSKYGSGLSIQDKD